MNLQIVNASIFTTGAKYILHQCNCRSIKAAGLAKDIFERYPYANCYSDRADTLEHAKPGTIQICGDGLKQRYIINMFAQYYPGTATPEIDSAANRKKWFFNCLMEIAKIDSLDSIAIPDHIGCGLAGGDWEWYFKKIQAFTKYVENKAVVLLYKV